MKTFLIPTPDEIRVLLKPLPPLALKLLGRMSNVSGATLLKIKSGAIADPGIVTVARFLPNIEAVLRVFTPPADPPPVKPSRRRSAPTASAPSVASAPQSPETIR